MSFAVIPAIDLRGGRVVRLYQGDYARRTDYAVEPLALAHEYAAQGAEWLHVVDLDSARDGGCANLRTITALVHAGMKVQAGGGVRDEGGLQRLFDAGVERAVVGSLAVREPQRVCEWIDRHGAGRLTIALDTRWRDGAWRLPSAGWERDEPAMLDELAPRYAAAGALHLLCTDIDRDGTLGGPNFALYRHLARIAPSLRVQVSGGVRDLDDVCAARASGAAAVVLGRALLDGRFALDAALRAGRSC